MMLWLAKYVEERPDDKDLKVGVVYVVGPEREEPWCIIFRCPCGCTRPVNIPVQPGPQPRWDMTVADNKRVTLSPSLRRTCECKSHFFMKNGQIDWCGDSPNRGTMDQVMQLVESKRRDGVMAKGEWRGTQHPVSGKQSALICCPKCGKIGSLLDHDIDPDGSVFPSLVCPLDCGFHKYVKLADWKA